VFPNFYLRKLVDEFSSQPAQLCPNDVEIQVNFLQVSRSAENPHFNGLKISRGVEKGDKHRISVMPCRGGGGMEIFKG